jgi:hypothetical protein
MKKVDVNDRVGIYRHPRPISCFRMPRPVWTPVHPKFAPAHWSDHDGHVFGPGSLDEVFPNIAHQG